jgi:peptide/nickel transport system permease protein
MTDGADTEVHATRAMAAIGPRGWWPALAVPRQLRNPLVAGAIVVVGLLVVMSARPGWFTDRDPYRIDPIERLKAPSTANPFGTDEMGRDIYTRIVHGTHLTLGLAALVVALSTIVGTAIGLFAGYCGRWVDEVVMRVTDVFLAFPPLILAMAIVASLGQSMLNSVLGVSGIWWAQYARLVRTRVLELKEQEFVLGARALGSGHARLLMRHVVPNGLAPVIVKASIDLGLAILMLSALSFMGLGAKPPIPEWGAMITTGRNYFLDYWWVPTFPGLAIFVTVLAFNLLGDWVRDVLDPRSAG